MGSLIAVEGKVGEAYGELGVSPYGCSVILTAKKKVPNATGTAIAWDSDEGALCFNEGQCWTSTNKSRFVAPSEGLYRLGFSIRWAGTAAGERLVSVTVNGSSLNKVAEFQGSSSNKSEFCQASAWLKGGDYLEARVFQETGATEELYEDSYGTDFKIGRAVFEKVR